MTRDTAQSGGRKWSGASCALAISATAWAVLSSPLPAQTHKVAKPENVVRAVGVYEWTGDMAKPTASRIVPVSLFIDGKLQDAGVYLARPVPMALLGGNVYELDQAGIGKGTIDLLYSRHFEVADTASTNYDDGWFGYGKFVPPAPPRKATLRPSKTVAVINPLDDDPSKPHFSSKSATPGSGGAAAPAPGTASTNAPPGDPDRPTLHRSSTSGTDQTASGAGDAGATPAADPDRPTMHRSADTSDQTASTGASGTGSASSGSGASSSNSDPKDSRDTPVDDPDRPTLRRRTPEQAAKAKANASHDSVTAVGSLNDDPNRPMLHRGKPAGEPTETELPKLSGLPGDQDLHQMVAVSDAADRPAHDFSRAWADEAEHQDVLAKMQAAARAQLTAYEAANAPKPAAPAAPAPDTRHPNTKVRKATTPDTNLTPPPPEPLLDEQLKAYTLSYGGAATYIYSAHTGGLGPALRFVTLVAQVNMQGEPETALKSVTDAAHLDRTPRMKLVDVVDAEASNRASLLFELREQSSRQFALYRVIGARADQTFLTGTTQ
jgi:hypothetical protein